MEKNGPKSIIAKKFSCSKWSMMRGHIKQEKLREMKDMCANHMFGFFTAKAPFELASYTLSRSAAYLITEAL